MIDYTGYDERGKVFDSTNGEIAKTLHGKEGPLIFIFKLDSLPIGLEEALVGMNIGEEKELTLPPEKAFGEVKKSLVKVFSTAYFQSQNVNPVPGLAIYLDTDKGRIYGIVKSVNSGRVVVSFNHPLAGEKVRYRLKLVGMLASAEEKIKALLARYGIIGNAVLKDGNLILELPKKPENIAAYERSKLPLVMSLKKIFIDIKGINVKEID